MANISISHTEIWDETKPAGSRAVSLGDDDIREFKTAIEERLAVDHAFVADETGETDIGIHKKVTFKVLGADPTAYDDVAYYYVKLVGSEFEAFYMDTAGNVLQLTSVGKILLDNGRLSNNTNLIARNNADDGDVDLIKANASDNPEIPDGAVLASNAAPSEDAGIANKKYVDDRSIAYVTGLGSWLSRNKDTVYEAATDGFVCAYSNAESGAVTGYTDGNNPPTTIRMRDNSELANYHNLMMPVKSGDFWKVNFSANGTIFWIPLS